LRPLGGRVGVVGGGKEKKTVVLPPMEKGGRPGGPGWWTKRGAGCHTAKFLGRQISKKGGTDVRGKTKHLKGDKGGVTLGMPKTTFEGT